MCMGWDGRSILNLFIFFAARHVATDTHTRADNRCSIPPGASIPFWWAVAVAGRGFPLGRSRAE